MSVGHLLKSLSVVIIRKVSVEGLESGVRNKTTMAKYVYSLLVIFPSSDGQFFCFIVIGQREAFCIFLLALILSSFIHSFFVIYQSHVKFHSYLLCHLFPNLCS